MNKFGLLSIILFVVSVIFFFMFRGPNANMELGISVFGVLSILGIIFAFLSKKLMYLLTGVTLNGAVLAFAALLLLAWGIGES
ncbi:hypothetical protein [Sutcliffiella cohnii]|nr:hypothetical protein [Sutcliffiella cohnii]